MKVQKMKRYNLRLVAPSTGTQGQRTEMRAHQFVGEKPSIYGNKREFLIFVPGNTQNINHELRAPTHIDQVKSFR